MHHHVGRMDARLDSLRTLLGIAPARVVRAPGRVNLIGDHTDYCEGFVIPMAIDRDCLVAVAPSSGSPERRGRVRARSLDIDGMVEVATDGSTAPTSVEPSWGRFVAGVVQSLADRGASIPGLDVAISSTVPAGSGLSSSSALAVALTLAFAEAGGLALTRTDAARVALDAELRAAGVPGGLMDQLASLFGEPGHALLIDCRSLDIEPIALPDALAVIVVHSGVARTLATSAFAERRSACEAAAARLGVATLRDATLDRVRGDPRARHVVTENARVLQFAAALRTGDLNALGPLLLESHGSLRDDFEVSTPELDLLVEVLVDAGAYGARLTGAGFGGCVVALTPSERAPEVMAQAAGRYRARTGIEPDAFRVDAVEGAGSIRGEGTT
jgi:galactokinase